MSGPTPPVWDLTRVRSNFFSFAYSDGFNSIPLPFSCDISPRSVAHAKVIEREYEEAMTELTSYNAVTNMVS